MSSSRTEIAAGHAAEPRPRKRGWLKSMLPRTLFGRSILILVTPFILVQAVATWVFYDRLWDTVLRRLAAGVAGDIALVVDGRSMIGPESDQAVFLGAAAGATELGFQVIPGAKLADVSTSPPDAYDDGPLSAAVAERVQLPFQIRESFAHRKVYVSFQLPDGVLEVSVPRSRIYTSDNWIFMAWMVSTALITCGVATIFLKNQIRSLRRLAVAADAFGKGRDMPDFRPEGAAEVRQAAAAFLVMRERLHRQITQRTEMLAGVSHDLRTPLTRMKLELELMGEGEETQGLRADVAEMQVMLEGYLSFARGEGNEAPQVTDLVELVGDAVATARRGGSSIALLGPTELHMPVRRDALRRCIMNLLGNADRHASHVWVTVVGGRRAVEILIDDDGPGIPEAEREAVFRPFFRLEGSRNRSTGGVGLGLTIARDIMRSHGGDLTLEQSPRGGLRARLHLPR